MADCEAFFDPGVVPIYTDGLAFAEAKEGGICMFWYVETPNGGRTIVSGVFLPYSKIVPSREIVNSLLQGLGKASLPVELPAPIVH